MGADGIQEWAQYIALWRAGADYQGKVGAFFCCCWGSPYSRWREEVQGSQLVDKDVGDDGVEVQTVVDKEHPNGGPQVFQMAQNSAESYEYGIFGGPVCSVCKLTGVKNRNEALFDMVWYVVLLSKH